MGIYLCHSKYQSKIDDWGVQVMFYLWEFLPKDAHAILRQCDTDGHQVVQLLHLKFHPIHVRHRTDQCKTVPVLGNLSINAYIRSYIWHVMNLALILNESNDIGDVYTQDICIFNIKCCDDVRSIFTFKRTSPD